MLCKKKKNFTLKYYAKKKNCLDESNEMFKGTNFILEYYAKKKKIVSTNRMKKKNYFENKSNESIKGTNFVLKCYAKKKKKRRNYLDESNENVRGGKGTREENSILNLHHTWKTLLS